MNTKTPSAVIVGDGPVALMTLSELVEKAEAPLSVTVIGQNPKEKFGFGAISDTELEGAFANVLAKKMSIDPAKSGEGRFTVYLKELGLDRASWEEANTAVDHAKLAAAGLDNARDWQRTKDWITRFNAADTNIADQYIPRALLHGMIAEFAAEVEEKAADKGIAVHHIHADATDIVPDKKQVRVEIQEGGKPVATVTADTAAVTIGLPQSIIPGQSSIQDASRICADVHHPVPGNVLSAEPTGKKRDIVIIGSGLTAVDAVMALEKKEFFSIPQNKATLVSPSGKLPYPHELVPTAAYDGAFLNSEDTPARLKTAATAKDLSDAVILSALHAMGAKWYETEGQLKFATPAHGRFESEAVARLVAEGEAVLQTSPSGEHEQLKRVFTQEGIADERPRYSWQSVMDHFRPQMPGKWQEFSDAEKQSWVSHYAKIWGDFRNRVPAHIHETLQELKDSGRLVIQKGRVEALTQAGEKVAVHMEGQPIITGDEVLNATGWGSPDRDSPLLSAMRSHNAITISPVEGVKSKEPRVIMIGQNDGNPRAISATGWTELRAAAAKGAEAILAGIEAGRTWEGALSRDSGQPRAGRA